MKFSAFLTALFLIFVFQFASAQTKGQEYIGFQYKGVTPNTVLPNGVKHFGGGLIGGVSADPVYGISQVSKGKLKMLWLEVSIGKDENGVTGWQVKDVLSFYNQRPNDHLLFLYDPSIECTRKGDPIERLVGIGKIVRQQGIFRPSALWAANLKKEKFVPFSATGVKCIYAEP